MYIVTAAHHPVRHADNADHLCFDSSGYMDNALSFKHGNLGVSWEY